MLSKCRATSINYCISHLCALLTTIHSLLSPPVKILFFFLSSFMCPTEKMSLCEEMYGLYERVNISYTEQEQASIFLYGFIIPVPWYRYFVAWRSSWRCFVYCVHLVMISQGKRSGQAVWTVHNVQNHTLLGHSPTASQAGRRVGPAL